MDQPANHSWLAARVTPFAASSVRSAEHASRRAAVTAPALRAAVGARLLRRAAAPARRRRLAAAAARQPIKRNLLRLAVDWIAVNQHCRLRMFDRLLHLFAISGRLIDWRLNNNSLIGIKAVNNVQNNKHNNESLSASTIILDVYLYVFI